jgi:hypothetical protein
LFDFLNHGVLHCQVGILAHHCDRFYEEVSSSPYNWAILAPEAFNGFCPLTTTHVVYEPLELILSSIVLADNGAVVPRPCPCPTTTVTRPLPCPKSPIFNCPIIRCSTSATTTSTVWPTRDGCHPTTTTVMGTCPPIRCPTCITTVSIFLRLVDCLLSPDETSTATLYPGCPIEPGCYTETVTPSPTPCPGQHCIEPMCVERKTTTLPPINPNCRTTPVATLSLPCGCHEGCGIEWVTQHGP